MEVPQLNFFLKRELGKQLQQLVLRLLLMVLIKVVLLLLFMRQKVRRLHLLDTGLAIQAVLVQHGKSFLLLLLQNQLRLVRLLALIQNIN
jgi:hypothetical protein